MLDEVWRGLLALGVAVLATLGLGLRQRTVRWVLITALVLRAGLALFHYFVFPLPDSQADALMFERTAREWASGGWGSLLKHWQSGALLYSWLLGAFYLLFGPSALMAQVINVLLGVLNVYLVWRIAREALSEQAARWAAWTACFFPTLNLYSALTMREAVFVFLVLAGALWAIRWFKERKLAHFMWAVVFLVLATGFHLGAWPLIWSLGLWALGQGAYSTIRAKRIPWPMLGELAVVAASTAFIVLFKWGWDKGGVFEIGIGNVQKAYAIGRAAYLQNLTVQSVLDLFWQEPIRVLFFLFTPFPWMVREPLDLLGLFDAVLYLALVILLAWALLRSFAADPTMFLRIFFLVILAAFGIAAFAAITSNYGAAIRHRAKFVPFLLVACAPTFAQIGTWRKRYA